MDHVSLLQAERQRHNKALHAALDHAALLKQHVDRSTLLSSDSVRDRVAVRLIEAPDDQDSSVSAVQQADTSRGAALESQRQQLPALRTAAAQASSASNHVTRRLLLEAAKIQHVQSHAEEVAELAADTAALQVSAAALDKDAEMLQRRFIRKRQSLAEAIADDARLVGMTEAEIMEEVRARGAEMAKRQQLLDTFSSLGPGQQQQQQQKHRTQQGKASSIVTSGQHRLEAAQPRTGVGTAAKGHQLPGTASSQSSSWRPPGFHGGDGAHEAMGEDDSEGGHAECYYAEGSASYNHATQAADAAAEAASEDAVAAGLPGMLQYLSEQRNRGLPNKLHLEDVAAAVNATIPQQQEQLAAMRRKSAVTATRLNWQVKRPHTYAGDLALTAHQRSIKAFVQSILEEVLESAMVHISMRPTKQQVAVELAEWRARQPEALAAISRHVGDSIHREVVDELLAEVAAEAAAAAAAADAFSFDMLVAAVAFSQGKYDMGFNVGAGQGSAAAAGATAGYAGQTKAGGVAREAALLQKAAERGAALKDDAASAGAATITRPVIVAGDVDADIAEEDVYLARRDFAAADGAADGTGKGQGQQQFKTSVHGLYYAGLRGMLWEMRNRRPADTPYGHTQQLAPHFLQGAATNKARRLAVARQRPPLAASAAVWARREVAVGHLEPGGWPHATHLAAAVREREFWSKVGVKPRMQKVGLPGPAVLSDTSLVVPEALGSVTTLSGCPAGTFLAAGTNRGSLLVWDMREDAAVNPWFQVTGTGQLYKRRWWNPWAAKPPRRPAITGFCWSADSYQLAGVDASSNLKVWWMRPEERDDGQSVAELQAKNAPVTPELAVLVSPFMVAITGKAPIAEEDDAATAAANAAAVDAANAAVAAGDTLAAMFTQKLGQWLGLASSEQHDTIKEVPSRQLRPVFHPAFTITGTQPTVVVPQVTGDVLSITTDIGGPILPGFGPSVAAERARLPTGLAAANTPPSPAEHGSGNNLPAAASATKGPGDELSEAVVDYLMPPQARNPDIVSQALYRCHDSHIVFLGFLSDAASLISLDSSGQLALWPTSTSQRSGFGWIQPRKRWQLPRTVRTCLTRSGLHPFWPALPGRFARTGVTSKSSSIKGGKWWGSAAAADGSFLDDALEEQANLDANQLQQDPQGNFLLHTRLPWLVRYLPSNSKGQVIRQVTHRPLDDAGPGSTMLVVSSYDAESGELLMRARQRCSYHRTPVKVVAAEMTNSKRELVILCSVPPQQDDPDGHYLLTVFTINLASMKALVPRIDAPDPSNGKTAPAYALSQMLTSMGTEYLFLNLGCAVIGVYSLASGQLVREIATGILGSAVRASGRVGDLDGRYFQCLALMCVSDKQGRFSNSGRTLLAASFAGGQQVFVMEVDVEGAAGKLLEHRIGHKQTNNIGDSQQQQADSGPPQAVVATAEAIY